MPIAMELVPPEVAVDPGRLACIHVHLTNSGPETRDVAVEVPVAQRQWTWVHPESCGVVAGGEVVVDLFFKPACGPHPTAGRHPVEIVARCGAEVAATAHGTVEVGPWVDAVGVLEPMVARDQRSHRYTFHLENRGNVPLVATLGTEDPSGALDVDVQPRRVGAEPGAAATATVTVQARKKLKRGEQRYRVCVLAGVEGGSELRIEGTFYQQGLKPAR